ncbi:MAG: hypothetical protein KF745_09340 [Phycisphaeraceae bacterium]|nr:hypothetical protein [Phycisphaeraceae bacterium]
MTRPETTTKENADADVLRAAMARGGIRCPGCGYEATSLDGVRCPECGVELDLRKIIAGTMRTRVTPGYMRTLSSLRAIAVIGVTLAVAAAALKWSGRPGWGAVLCTISAAAPPVILIAWSVLRPWICQRSPEVQRRLGWFVVGAAGLSAAAWAVGLV